MDPISLVLADEDLSARFNFDPITEAVDIEFFQEYLSEEIIETIKSTSFFKEVSEYFAAKEKMTPAVFDVVRNQAFDVDSLDEIAMQRHLLNINEQLILDILQAKIELTNIYPDCCMLGYFTSVRSKYRKSGWHSAEYDQYLIVIKYLINRTITCLEALLKYLKTIGSLNTMSCYQLAK